MVGSGTVSDSTANSSTLASSPNQMTTDSKTPIVSNKTFIEPEMVVIPAGRFKMGSYLISNSQPIIAVNISKPFLIAKYLVTFDEYELFVKAKNWDLPSDQGWGGGKRPVINISWVDATAYASWLSEVTGKSYRLPSEAEWEYAARAGTESAYYWGDNENDADNFAWFDRNSNEETHPVGEKQSNKFDLYDMAGNVWEWVQDCYHDKYDKAPADGSSRQEFNNGDSTRRVVRGGSWYFSPVYLRSANRLWNYSITRINDLGCRLAQDWNQRAGIFEMQSNIALKSTKKGS